MTLSLDTLGLDVGRYGRILLFGANLMLVFCLAWLVAQLVWLVLAGPAHKIEPVSVAASGSGPQAAADYSVLERLSPFRQGSVTEAGSFSAAEEDAPETALNLTFHGARIDAGDAGVAYISIGSGPQERFAVGDTIGNQQAVLERIYSDGVILRREGRLEKLQSKTERAIVSLGPRRNSASIDGVTVAEPEAQVPVAAANAASVDSGASQDSIVQTRMTRTDMTDLAQSIRLEPQSALGLQGYAIYPTRRSALMAQAGLRPGDILVSVAGRPLADYEEVRAALDALDRENGVELGLVRDGQRLQLAIQFEEINE